MPEHTTYVEPFMVSGAVLLGKDPARTEVHAVSDDPSMIAFLPDWVAAITLPLLPTALAAVAGFKAKHAARPDLPADQR